MINLADKPKWQLRHWSHYVNQRENLSETERDDAIVFFKALQALPADDVAFLARKYKTGIQANPNTNGTTDKPVPDRILLKTEGMDQMALTNKRRKIERQLFLLMVKEREKLGQHKAAQLGRWKFKLGRLYLVSIDVANMNYTTVLLTNDAAKATIYTNDEANKWGLFFTKVPVNETPRE